TSSTKLCTVLLWTLPSARSPGLSSSLSTCLLRIWRILSVLLWRILSVLLRRILSSVLFREMVLTQSSALGRHEKQNAQCSGLARYAVRHEAARCSERGPLRHLMPLQEDVILPAAHAQQDFAQQRDMVPVLGIDRDLGGGAERDLITGDVVGDVDDGQCPAAGRALGEVHERSCRLDLTGCDRIQHEAHLALEHAAGHGVKGDLSLVTGPDPLQ